MFSRSSCRAFLEKSEFLRMVGHLATASHRHRRNRSALQLTTTHKHHPGSSKQHEFRAAMYSRGSCTPICKRPEILQMVGCLAPSLRCRGLKHRSQTRPRGQVSSHRPLLSFFFSSSSPSSHHQPPQYTIATPSRHLQCYTCSPHLISLRHLFSTLFHGSTAANNAHMWHDPAPFGLQDYGLDRIMDWP